MGLYWVHIELFTGCLLDVYWVCIGCILDCLLGVYWVYTGCVLGVYWVFYCVYWMSTGCLLGAYNGLLTGFVLGMYYTPYTPYTATIGISACEHTFGDHYQNRVPPFFMLTFVMLQKCVNSHILHSLI